MTRSIIWDLDGTLIDTYGGIVNSYIQAMTDMGIDHIDKSRVFDLVKIDSKHCAEVLAIETGLHGEFIRKHARSIYDKFSTAAQKPFPFVESVCKRIINEGGKNLIVTHRDRASTNELLERNGLLDLFSEIVTADDGFPEKPIPASFIYLLEKHRLQVNSTLGVGDRDLDVGAANSAGIFSIYFCPAGSIHTRAKRSISCISELEE